MTGAQPVPPEERISRQAEDSERRARTARAAGCGAGGGRDVPASGAPARRFRRHRLSIPLQHTELAHKLALVAQDRCKGALDAYNDCCRGRSVSMVWACREAYRASEACIAK
jgi:hypothetical protein